MVPIVTEEEKITIAHVCFELTVGPFVRIEVWRFVEYHTLGKRRAHNRDGTVVNPHRLSGQPDDALDKVLCGVQRVPEDDDITALRWTNMQAVRKLVDNEVLTVVKIGGHACPPNKKRLRYICAKGNDDRQAHQKDFGRVPDIYQKSPDRSPRSRRSVMSGGAENFIYHEGLLDAAYRSMTHFFKNDAWLLRLTPLRYTSSRTKKSMSPRPFPEQPEDARGGTFSAGTLSVQERDVLLREVRATDGTHIPVRTFRVPSRGGGSAAHGRASADEGRSVSRGDGDGVPSREDRKRPPGGPPRLVGITPPSPRRGRRVLLWTLVALVLLVGLGAAKLLRVGGAILTPERSIIGQLTDLLFHRGSLAGESDNRVNILLVAVGGEGHQGENLADSVILASLRPKENDVAFLSIPRDLYVKIPGAEFYTRINAVHAYGENQRRGDGLKLLQKKVTEITGQPVQYLARVDFTAFKRIVDEVGGIDITIRHSFYDYWHKISFPEGTEHMNGERALAYVRARYIEGPEGGDFKRAERTQQVILAIRKRVLSAQTVVDLRALAGILDALHDNVATNFTLAGLRRLAELTRAIPDDRLDTAVLTTGPEGLLVGTTEILSGRPAAVLRPRAGLEQYGEIAEFARDIFAQARVAPPPATTVAATSTPETPPATPTASGSVTDEQPTVEVRNGTNVVGLAARAAKVLEKQGFTIVGVGNAAIRNRTQTLVIDRTGGKKPASLRAVLDTFGITAAVTFPEAEKQSIDASVVIFLGTDLAEKLKK